METSGIIAASRQGALRRQLQVVANNLANINTTGFKAERMMFVEHVVKSKGGEKLIHPRHSYVRDIATRVDPSSGSIEQTGNSLDIAVQGDGFFAIQGDGGQEQYTRNGRFQLSPDGTVVTQDGFPLLSEGGGTFVLNATDTDITISRDGTFSTSAGELGKIRVVRFENLQNMERTAGARFTTEDQPEDIAQPSLVQGALEGSNVSPIEEMSKMIALHRTYDHVRSFIQREDDRQREMVRTFSRDT